MFDLNKITHIDNIKEYTPEMIAEMTLVCGKRVLVEDSDNSYDHILVFQCKCGRRLVLYYTKGYSDLEYKEVEHLTFLSTEDENKMFHNDIGIPADIAYDLDGNIYAIEYFEHGKSHNIGHPSRICYSYNFRKGAGKVKGRFVVCVMYKVKGVLHNSIGPAYVDLEKDDLEFFMSGESVTREKFFDREIFNV